MAGRFEVLLLEALDRLSRDSVEQERIVRRLEHRGIRIIGCLMDTIRIPAPRARSTVACAA
jgi:DNA invertase Pin-like site-specific DNA recombinase